MGIKKLMMVATLVAAFSPFANAQSKDWVVSKRWTPALEDKFSEFVATMGKARCGTIDKCLKSSTANPFYYKKTPTDVSYYADCADLPYVLRAYFAWMEGLPFDYVNKVSGTGNDIRYSKNGNSVQGYKALTMGNVYNGPRELRNISNTVSTAMYRMHYSEVSDFYPAGINRKDIRPGTVLYDAAGHAGIIYDVDSNDGTIKMMDAHPDNSITRIRFDKKFSRSRIEHGAGFKNWRPELDYNLTEHLPGFSTERFQSNFTFNGERMDYYDYVRTMMSGGNMHVNPVAELKASVAELCMNVHDRVTAVEDGLKSGIQNKNHPETLPKNIYGTTGEWEDYSTPSRDARLKTGFASLLSETKRYVGMYREGSNRISYEPTRSRYSRGCGSNTCYLAASLLEAYEEATQSAECQFNYVKSNGRRVNMGYEDIVSRLFKMSFDPYHCAELRWGATGAELDSCGDGRTKRAWYDAEQGLRNQIERKYDDVMNFDVRGTAKLGQSNPPDVDLVGYLESLLK